LFSFQRAEKRVKQPLIEDVMHELSYDKTIGERSDVEAVIDVVSKNFNKYISL